MRELELQFKAYEYYLQAIKRDGVPYQLISKALPQIEAEINNILTQIVDFTILLETDGKNINGYIVYDSSNYWPLELTSGMEKFISSLAIRASLINITSLPRPNFLAIDEGFGVLDSDNLNSMYLLFDYLKTQFNFILCISHIDAMRDVVDKLIEIKKENTYSQINYV
jgi:DNA repair exonuclease SbcCD ATPase subunit